MTKVNSNPNTYADIKVYASNPFIDTFDGQVKMVNHIFVNLQYLY